MSLSLLAQVTTDPTPISAAEDIVHVPGPDIYWPALLGIAATSVITAPLGAWLAHRLPVPVLKRLFAALLLGVGSKLLWSTLDL